MSGQGHAARVPPGGRRAGPLLEPASRTGLPPIPRAHTRRRLESGLPLTARQRRLTHLGGTNVTDLDCGHLAMYERPAHLAPSSTT
ncbi:hypothetical protein ABZZ80_41680 [Streptomyces sp. NPDC006356]